MNSLEDIRGIGPQAAVTLAEGGFPDAKAVADATAEEIATVHGFSLVRAKKTIEAAKEVVNAAADESVTDPASDEVTASQAEKNSKKGSGGKKKKKSDKKDKKDKKKEKKDKKKEKKDKKKKRKK